MKRVTYFFIAAFAAAMLFGCSESFSPSHEIHAITREEGSGTRIEFCGPLGLTVNGVDTISSDIAVTNSTAVVLSSVSKNCHAVGYISLGSLDNSVKAVSVNGVYPSAESISDGSYPLVRPFILIYRRKNTAAQALCEYILSDNGRTVIKQCGYAPPDDTAIFDGHMAEDLTVIGSSSVYPLMEQLREGYIEIYPDVRFELLQSDSSSGAAAVRDGLCDIGMMSRLPADDELSDELAYTIIALDGIAVIVSRNNPVTDLSGEQLRQIYSREVTAWDGIMR